MPKMSRAHKLILLTFIGTSFLQMPQMGLSPAIEYIKNNVFRDRSLSEIQTAQTFLNIMVTAAALIAALLIAKRVFSKKTVAVGGLFILGATGPLSLVLHTQYWHLWLLSGASAPASAPLCRRWSASCLTVSARKSAASPPASRRPPSISAVFSSASSAARS